MDINLDDKFVKELVYKIVRNCCPSRLDEICGIELDDIEECEKQDIKGCKECWEKAVKDWLDAQ